MKKSLCLGHDGYLRFQIPEDNQGGVCVMEDLHFCLEREDGNFRMHKRKVILTYRETAKLRDWLNERLKGTKYESK